MIRFTTLWAGLAVALVPAAMPGPAAACSIVAGGEASPAAQRRQSRKRIERATAIIDGEVVRPFRRGEEPALVRAHRVLKGPARDHFAVGERDSCDIALDAPGERLRLILTGGPDIYYLEADRSNARHEDRLLGSDRRKAWPYRPGSGRPPPPPAIR